MTNTPMTPDQEFDFYAQPENQEPQGPARRRHASRLGTPVPVRVPPELLKQARRRGRCRRPVAHRRGSAGRSSTNCAGDRRPDPSTAHNRTMFSQPVERRGPVTVSSGPEDRASRVSGQYGPGSRKRWGQAGIRFSVGCRSGWQSPLRACPGYSDLLEQVLLVDQDRPLRHVPIFAGLPKYQLGRRAQATAGEVGDHENCVVPGRVEPQGIRLPVIPEDLGPYMATARTCTRLPDCRVTTELSQ